MQFWLVKSEPDSFSWDDQVALGAAGGPWDGIRNYQARNNIRAMALGEVTLKDWWRVARRELPTGFSLGLLLGAMGFVPGSVEAVAESV